MQPFVAIDFETANEKRRSACSVGLVRYDSMGDVEGRYHSLLHPHEEVNYFNPINTWVHGLRAEDVKDAPEWGDIATDIANFVGNTPLVAHNMPFDGSVLNGLADLYPEAPSLRNARLCTLKLAKRILIDVDLESYRLDDVYDHYFPGEIFEHHDATADAEACGRVFTRMQAEYDYEVLEATCAPARRKRRTVTRQLPATSPRDLAALLEEYGSENALAGEHIAMTGTLTHGKRDLIKEFITALGGVVENSTNKKTTTLLFGIPDPSKFSVGASASKKMDKASQLRDKGFPIEIVSEEEFFNRLKDKQQG